jgi:PAS domain S-box-containing protein
MLVNAIPEFHEGESAPFRAFLTLHDITEYQKAQKHLRQREQQVETLLAESQQARKALLSILEDDWQAQQALRESDELLRTVVATASDAIITIDGSGRIILWNRAAERIFGYSQAEIIGGNFSMLFPENIRELHLANLRNAIDPGVPALPSKFFEFPRLRKDGTEFCAEIAFGFIAKQDEILITEVVRDITERKLIEQEAMRSAQLASIGELAAGVAHEINNPIMGVINYAQIMLNKSLELGADTDLPERIIQEGNRIAVIVSNLLNFSRSVVEEITPVPLHSIFDPSLQLMWKSFQQSGVRTEVQLPECLPRVLVRPQKIQQVFINVLSNALYALNNRFPDFHEDKRIDIRAEEVREPGGDYVRIDFHDCGCGIEQEYLEKICNPFFTTKPAGHGTGLGLSICHNIIKEHGGRLLFESRAGEFTRVMVDLPAERPVRSAPAQG